MEETHLDRFRQHFVDRLGLYARQIAERCEGVRAATVSSYLRGDTPNPKLNFIAAIGQGFEDWSIDYWLNGDTASKLTKEERAFADTAQLLIDQQKKRIEEQSKTIDRLFGIIEDNNIKPVKTS